jgi:hypothetical protein
MGTEVVNWQERLAKQAKDVAAVERPSVGRISLRAGQMTWEGQAIPGNSTEVVIVAYSQGHTYYDKPFDPNNPASPICFSVGMPGEKLAPHADVKQKQNVDCPTCPLNQWASDPKGGRGKACKETRKLVVAPATETGKAEFAMLSLPVTSLRGWANYVNLLASQYQRPPWAVITRISTKPDPSTMFKVNFECVGILADEMLAAVEKRVDAANNIALMPFDTTGEAEAAPIADQPAKKKKY